MGVTIDVEFAEGLYGSLPNSSAYLAGGYIAAHDLGHFDVQQRRSVQGVGQDQPVADDPGVWQPEQPLDHNRGIEDDHLASRAARALIRR